MHRRDAVTCVALFVATMVILAVFRAVLPPGYRANESTDFITHYEPVAQSLLAGRGIRDSSGELATRYPPGFSILLAGAWGIGGTLGVPDDVTLFAFQLACAGLAVVTLYGLARTVWPVRAATGVAGIWMTYPFFLWLYKQPNSEVAFTPVMLAALLIFWRTLLSDSRAWWRFVAVGCACGAAMLIRPSAIGLGVVLAGLLLFWSRIRWQRRVAFASLILAGNIAVVLPWMAAASAAHGRVVPLSTGDAASIRDGLTFLVNPKEYRADAPVPTSIVRMMSAFERRADEMRSTKGAIVVMLDVASDAPGTFARLMLLKAARSWYGTDSLRLERPTIVLQALYLTMCVASLLLLARKPTLQRTVIGGLCVVVVYFWAVTVAVLPLLRYMVPAMALLFLALPALDPTPLLRRKHVPPTR